MTPSTSLVAMMLADARLPVGGHTQSGGLEPALRAGMEPGEIPGYCATRLGGVVLTEAATAVVAAHVLSGGGDLGPVHAHWAARTPSDAQRATSLELGRGLRRFAERLWPDHPALADWGTPPVRPLVLGAIGVCTGLGGSELARVVAYEDMQTVLAAGLKLAPADPLGSAAWGWRLLPLVERVATETGALLDPRDIPAQSSPQIEAWAQAHAQSTRRLFRA